MAFKNRASKLFRRPSTAIPERERPEAASTRSCMNCPCAANTPTRRTNASSCCRAWVSSSTRTVSVAAAWTAPSSSATVDTRAAVTASS